MKQTRKQIEEERGRKFGEALERLMRITATIGTLVDEMYPDLPEDERIRVTNKAVGVLTTWGLPTQLH